MILAVLLQVPHLRVGVLLLGQLLQAEVRLERLRGQLLPVGDLQELLQVQHLLGDRLVLLVPVAVQLELLHRLLVLPPQVGGLQGQFLLPEGWLVEGLLLVLLRVEVLELRPSGQFRPALLLLELCLHVLLLLLAALVPSGSLQIHPSNCLLVMEAPHLHPGLPMLGLLLVREVHYPPPRHLLLPGCRNWPLQ